MTYTPGLHILAEIKTKDSNLLVNEKLLRSFFNDRINAYHLQALGEVYHKFPGGGFTGVVCLTESHIAIHTWPEYQYLTFDIYLSNFSKSNDETARNFFRETVKYFQSEDFTFNELKR